MRVMYEIRIKTWPSGVGCGGAPHGAIALNDADCKRPRSPAESSQAAVDDVSLNTP